MLRGVVRADSNIVSALVVPRQADQEAPARPRDALHRSGSAPGKLKTTELCGGDFEGESLTRTCNLFPITLQLSSLVLRLLLTSCGAEVF